MTTRRDVLKSAAAVMAGSFLPYAGSAPAAIKNGGTLKVALTADPGNGKTIALSFLPPAPGLSFTTVRISTRKRFAITSSGFVIKTLVLFAVVRSVHWILSKCSIQIRLGFA